tara:strand:- start:40 stop:219 length:180 start_codon:yes stop_codon:yes gene_type:complete
LDREVDVVEGFGLASIEPTGAGKLGPTIFSYGKTSAKGCKKMATTEVLSSNQQHASILF